MNKSGIGEELEGNNPRRHGTHAGGGREIPEAEDVAVQDIQRQGGAAQECIGEIHFNLRHAVSAAQENRIPEFGGASVDHAAHGRGCRREAHLIQNARDHGRALPCFDAGRIENGGLIGHQGPAQVRGRGFVPIGSQFGCEGVADIQGVVAAATLAESEDHQGPLTIVDFAVAADGPGRRKVQVIDKRRSIHGEAVGIG